MSGRLLGWGVIHSYKYGKNKLKNDMNIKVYNMGSTSKEERQNGNIQLSEYNWYEKARERQRFATKK